MGEASQFKFGTQTTVNTNQVASKAGMICMSGNYLNKTWKNGIQCSMVRW